MRAPGRTALCETRLNDMASELVIDPYLGCCEATLSELLSSAVPCGNSALGIAGRACFPAARLDRPRLRLSQRCMGFLHFQRGGDTRLYVCWAGPGMDRAIYAESVWGRRPSACAILRCLIRSCRIAARSGAGSPLLEGIPRKARGRGETSDGCGLGQALMSWMSARNRRCCGHQSKLAASERCRQPRRGTRRSRASHIIHEDRTRLRQQ
jgi:hypothetical protein